MKGGDQIPILEEGRISFFYRPRVGLLEAHGLEDVKNFFIAMRPASRQGAPSRLLVVGRKRLPVVEQDNRGFFTFVHAVAPTLEELLAAELGEREYDTDSQGMRQEVAAFALGEGMYSIRGRSTLLTYELEAFSESQVQQDCCVGNTGSYEIVIKNPDAQAPAGQNKGLAAARAAQYTPQQQAKFRGRAWLPSRELDPELLDIKGTQLLLVAARPAPAGRVAKRQKEEAKVDTNKLEGGAAVEQPEVEAEDIKVEVAAGPDINGRAAKGRNRKGKAGPNKLLLEGGAIEEQPGVEAEDIKAEVDTALAKPVKGRVSKRRKKKVKADSDEEQDIDSDVDYDPAMEGRRVGKRTRRKSTRYC